MEDNHINPNDYRNFIQQQAPRSPHKSNLFRAFLIGGSICLIGQLLLNWLLRAGLDQEQAGSSVSIILVFLGTLLTGFGIYDDLAKLGGAGTLVPITGFANAVAAPALEFKSEGLVLGTAVKMFSIAGPVIVFGSAASVIYGLLLWLF